jgi:hypothetical protein
MTEGCTLSTVETDRWILHSRIREVLGNREGDILMEHLPPAGWSHLATKDDITMAKLELRAEMAEIKAELRADIADVRIAMEKGFRAHTWKMVAAMTASQGVSVAIMAAMVNSLR